MRYIIKEGDYASLGVERSGDDYTFTFECEKEDKCCIVITDEKEQTTDTIHVPANFCLGSLRSVQVCGIKSGNFLYYYEINGQKLVDPYAKAIAGREKWNDAARRENDYDVSGYVENAAYDWSDDVAPEIPKQDMNMYKLQ